MGGRRFPADGANERTAIAAIILLLKRDDMALLKR